MKIRRFSNGDEISLFRVFFSSVHTIASHYYTREQIDAWAPADIDLERWANHIKELQPFVVELDGEIAGYADVQPNGYIDHFFVSGTYSRQGVGTLLMNCIHEEARQR
ncbi:TPA: GNAT family N-acetyltransferase, partial [Salmonella enterica]